jgi:hypothetical protein
MNYVALLKFHNWLIEVDRHDVLERRASTNVPEGVSIVEYWPIGGMFDVISVISATRMTPVMELVAKWSRHFDINVRPAKVTQPGNSWTDRATNPFPELRLGRANSWNVFQGDGS